MVYVPVELGGSDGLLGGLDDPNGLPAEVGAPDGLPDGGGP